MQKKDFLQKDSATSLPHLWGCVCVRQKAIHILSFRAQSVWIERIASQGNHHKDMQRKVASQGHSAAQFFFRPTGGLSTCLSCNFIQRYLEALVHRLQHFSYVHAFDTTAALGMERHYLNMAYVSAGHKGLFLVPVSWPVILNPCM